MLSGDLPLFHATLSIILRTATALWSSQEDLAGSPLDAFLPGCLWKVYGQARPGIPHTSRIHSCLPALFRFRTVCPLRMPFTFSLMTGNLPMESDDQNHVSRRRFLQSLGLVGAVGASGSLLAACGGSDSSNGGSTESGSGGEGGAGATADCSDLSSLSDAQKKQRKQMVTSLKYKKESPKPNKNCGNCQLYQKKKFGSGCGGCQLFPGPVAQNGYCTSWQKKAA